VCWKARAVRRRPVADPAFQNTVTDNFVLTCGEALADRIVSRYFV